MLADLVIMSVGFRPRTEMVEAEKLPNGAIKVNDFQQILGDENILCNWWFICY